MVLVKDVMSSKISYLEADRTVREAAEVMARADVGSVLIYGLGKLVGIVTERDIVRKIVAEGFDASKVKVSDIMSTPLITVGPSDTIEEASETMTTFKIRRLPVVEGGRVVGIISANDIAAHLAKEKNYEDIRLNAIARIPKGELPPPYG